MSQPIISPDDVIRLRLAAHGLSQPLGLAPAALVDRAVAMQGQELSQVVRSIAIRARCADDVVAASFGSGLVRSWPMRGTLFATTPEWLASLLSLTGERVERMMVKRRERLGIAEADIDHAGEVAASCLARGPVGRADLLDAWEAAGIDLPSGRGYHLIVSLAVRGRVLWGPIVDGDHLLVAADWRAMDEDPVDVLARVSVAYFTARGPATVDDLAWWTKLPKRQVRAAVERAGDRLIAIDVAGTTMLVCPSLLDSLSNLPPRGEGTVWLLPRFDEWYLGYQDRSLVASAAMNAAICPKGNGVFRPIVVVDGQIVATWARDRSGVATILDQVENVTTRTARAIEEALAVRV